MDKKTLTLAIATVLLVALFSWVFIKDQSSDIPLIGAHRWVGRSCQVQRVNVLAGHEYDLQLTNGRRIRAYLEVRSAPEAKREVVRLLNESQNPRVVLLRRKDAGQWYVELLVQPQGRDVSHEVSVAEWLRLKHLIYDD